MPEPTATVSDNADEPALVNSDYLDTLQAHLAEGKDLGSHALMLPLLRIKGLPYTLEDHFMFYPLFSCSQPRRDLWLTARQVGKTQNVATAKLLRTRIIDFHTILFLCPRFEQIKRTSNSYMRPLIMTSPYKELFVGPQIMRGEQSVMHRIFPNESQHFYSFAFLDADRVRGISAGELCIDEVQDINWDFIPIIEETLSGSKGLRSQTFTGTPKTLDNTAEKLWEDSSQAAWVTQCPAGGCNYYNIAHSEHDGLAMFGKTTVCCAKCTKPINPSLGAWVHRYPDRQRLFTGRHVPQYIHPYHYSRPDLWFDLVRKRDSYPQSKFMNECMGESWDSAARLMTIRDLQKIQRVDHPNTIDHALRERRQYSILSVGIDWGGGGDESASYTSITFGGLKPGSDVIHTLYTEKLMRSMPVQDEIAYIASLIGRFRPDIVAHDYGGAGNIREVLLIQAGIPTHKLYPFTYVVSSKKAVMYYNPPSSGTRQSYSLDKARSIITTCAMMRAGKVRLPNFESCKTQAIDFLNLIEEHVERPRAADITIISKIAGSCDDTVHSLNYMASSIWYSQDSYPDLAAAWDIKLSQDAVESLSPTEPDWYNT